MLNFLSKIFRNGIFLFFIFLFSCGLYGKKDQTRWLHQYKEAKQNKDCRTLQELYKKSRFSLRDLARIQRYRYCLDQEDRDFQWDRFEPWMQKTALQAWFHRSFKNENSEGYIEASRRISEISPDYGDKVRYLLLALRKARKNNSPQKDSLIKELYSVSPSRNPKESDHLKVAYDYRKRNLFHKSIKHFRKVLNSKKTSLDVKQECYLNLQSLYKLTKNRTKHLSAVRQYGIFLKRNRHKNMKISNKYFSNQIDLAKSHWNNHDTEKALQVLNQMEKEYGDEAFLDQIYWLKGKIFEEKEEYGKAILFFSKAKETVKEKNSEFYEQVVWSLIWNLRKLKMYSKSIDLFTEFESDVPNVSSQFIFWKAHILEEMGLKTQADNYYRQLIDTVPFDFHGLMAHHKMKHPLSLDLVSEQPKSDNPYELMGDLILAEEKDLALKFMEHQIEEYNKRTDPVDQQEAFQLFSYSAQAGFYLPFFQFIGNMPPEEKSQFMQKYAHALFPRKYKEQVKKAETLFNTPSNVIYSIIRQESAFNRKALSPANAVGLMQVIPRVARSVARKEGISFRRFSDLYDPETNILIGTAYLNQLFQRYGGYLILNVAIYNAGQKPVKKWMERLSTDNPVEFIQSIPYNETRTYVRLIIRNLVFYELLNDPDNEIMFPSWMLNLPTNNEEVVSTIFSKKKN